MSADTKPVAYKPPVLKTIAAASATSRPSAGKSNTMKSPTARTAGIALGGVAAMLAVGACSSTASTPSQSPSVAPTSATATPVPQAPTPATPAPQSVVPGPPPGATQVSTQASGGGSYTRYRTGQTPTAVIAYYTGALKADGYTITQSGGGGGGWGQYGGSGAGLEADNSRTFTAVNAGGSKQGATYFEVCVGSTAAQVDACQSENHTSSGGS